MTRDRVKRSLLHRVHQGVFLFGTDVMLPRGAELAAVLACGDPTWVRRRSALSLLAVMPEWRGDVEVTVTHRKVNRAGIAAHRVPDLPAIDQAMNAGIPIVSPALALLEFAAVAVGDELERAISESYVLKLVTEPELRAVLDRFPNIPGRPALIAELDRAGGPQWTASKAERVMKALLRKADLPSAQTRVRVAGYPADFIWLDYKLIVEVDGYGSHGTRYAFERDRRRDQAHKMAGYEVIRFTWRNLENEPYRVVAVIAMAIGAARSALAR